VRRAGLGHPVGVGIEDASICAVSQRAENFTNPISTRRRLGQIGGVFTARGVSFSTTDIKLLQNPARGIPGARLTGPGEGLARDSARD
jgi:hypothetical protein